MRCIFSCLGDKKSRKKQISIPSKDQDEIIKPIKMITIEGKNTKLPITNYHEKLEDHVNEATVKTVEPESYSKEKKEARQSTKQSKTPNLQDHSDSSISSLFSYPINNVNRGIVEQESSDSLFSISVNSKKQSEFEEKEVNSPMKIREWPEKRNKIIGLEQSGLNPIKNFTHGILGESSIMMDDQEEEETVKKDHIFTQKLNFSKAEIETKTVVGLNHSEKIHSSTKEIENCTLSNAVKLGDLIIINEQEDKENIKSEQAISNQRSNFAEENKNIRSNHGVKTISLLNSIENLTHWKTGESGRFVLMDYQDEKEKIFTDQETRVPPLTCQKHSFRNSSRLSDTKLKEVLVDTSLSSWLVESERESDSPKSVKNSPDRENSPLRRCIDGNSLNDKVMPIVGTIGSFLESNLMPTPQARTRR